MLIWTITSKALIIVQTGSWTWLTMDLDKHAFPIKTLFHVKTLSFRGFHENIHSLRERTIYFAHRSTEMCKYLLFS